MGNIIPSTDFCTMTMTFNPHTGGTFNETLTIHFNDPDSPDYPIQLTGRSGSDGDGDGVLDIEETDIVRVIDHANSVSDEATVKVYRECILLHLFPEDSMEIAFLRKFRDEVLNTSSEGRVLVRIYYQWWPGY